MVRIEELAGGVLYVVGDKASRYITLDQYEHNHTKDDVVQKYHLLKAVDVGTRIQGVGSRPEEHIYYIFEEGDDQGRVLSLVLFKLLCVAEKKHQVTLTKRERKFLVILKLALKPLSWET